MATEKKFAVGDEVILVDPRSFRSAPDVVHTTISKVGRKYVYVEARWYTDVPFGMSDGYQASSNRSGSTRIYTPAEYEDNQKRQELVKKLREHQDTLSYRLDRLPLDKLEGLLAILEAEWPVVVVRRRVYDHLQEHARHRYEEGAADELTAATEELGLYTKENADDLLG